MNNTTKKMPWWRAFFFNRKAKKERKKEQLLIKTAPENFEKHAKDARKLGEYLSAIENQLDKVDEQNEMLLLHLSTVKDNNESLLEQVKVLSKNNEQLYEQFQASKKREKFAKIIAIIASGLAIGFWVYRFISIALGAGS